MAADTDCGCGCSAPAGKTLGCKCSCHDAVPVADPTPEGCDECGGGPDVTEHELWCEEGHAALRDEVCDLRGECGK